MAIVRQDNTLNKRLREVEPASCNCEIVAEDYNKQLLRGLLRNFR